MDIAIFGAGGVGGYLGARLADAGHSVSLIARGEHLRALQSDGLAVRSTAGDTTVELPATDDPSTIGPVDHVLFTVKANDTRSAARELPPLVDENTTVVSFQNGVDNEEWIAEEIGWEHVAGGVAYIFSTIEEPGVIEHTGGPDRFVFGELDGRRTERMERLADALAECEGLTGELHDDVRTELWGKFAFICAHAGMTATSRAPLGDIRETEASWEMYRRLLEEVVAVGRAEGIDLSEGTVDDWLAFAEDLQADATSSLHYDLTHRKPLELGALHGSVLRHAEGTGVAVPMNRAIHALLKPWENRFNK